MTILHETPDLGRIGRNFEIFDDFTLNFVDADMWTETIDTDSLTTSIAGAGGVLELETDGDDNDAVCIETRELFKLAANKPIYFKARLKVDKNTTTDNYAFGLCDAPTLDAPLADDGGTLAVPNDGIIFYTRDLTAETTWGLHTEIGTSGSSTLTDVAVDDDTFHEFAFEAQPKSATEISVRPFIDGAQCLDSNGNKIEHTIVLGTATEMALFFAAKTGAAAVSKLTVDYVYCGQTR